MRALALCVAALLLASCGIFSKAPPASGKYYADDGPPEKVPEDSKQILVAVSDKEEYFIDKEKMDLEAFESKIKEAFQRNPGSSIVIKADSRLTYGVVKKVMLTIRDAGFQQVGLVTLKKQQTMG